MHRIITVSNLHVRRKIRFIYSYSVIRPLGRMCDSIAGTHNHASLPQPPPLRLSSHVNRCYMEVRTIVDIRHSSTRRTFFTFCLLHHSGYSLDNRSCAQGPYQSYPDLRSTEISASAYLTVSSRLEKTGLKELSS